MTPRIKLFPSKDDSLGIVKLSTISTQLNDMQRIMYFVASNIIIDPSTG